MMTKTTEQSAGVPDSLSARWIDANAAIRHDISRYLHDTLAQDLVVLAFALEKMRFSPGFQPSPAFEQALGIVDKCCHDLRVLNLSLFRPAVDQAPLTTVLCNYTDRLRAEAGLKVEFDAEGAGSPGGHAVCALFLQALQEWAAKAILEGQLAGMTRIHLQQTAEGARLQLRSDRAGDPCILAVAGSVFLAGGTKELGGSIEMRTAPDSSIVILSAGTPGK